MVKQMWLNLPVRDMAKSKAFYADIGFTLNTSQGDAPDSGCVIVGQNNSVVMLFPIERMEHFMGIKAADTSVGSQMLISIDAESREEVEELARKANANGGNVFSEPEEIQGWMYGCGFADPDGHRWNVLFMDMEKMPK